jgi:hypothetical protein
MNRNLDPDVLDDVEEPHEDWGEISSELSELSRPRVSSSSQEFIGPKRLRGRPRKETRPTVQHVPIVVAGRRGRGRPRKVHSETLSERSRSHEDAVDQSTSRY